MAGLLLAGVLSDTLLLKSPTTTERDHLAVQQLADWSFGDDKLGFTNYQSFGEAVLNAGAGLAVRQVEDIVNSDLKIYEGGGIKFGVAQIDVANLLELAGRLPEISAALAALCEAKGLKLAVLMVTDVVRGASRLVLAGQVERLNDLPYTRLPDGTPPALDPALWSVFSLDGVTRLRILQQQEGRRARQQIARDIGNCSPSPICQIHRREILQCLGAEDQGAERGSSRQVVQNPVTL